MPILRKSDLTSQATRRTEDSLIPFLRDLPCYSGMTFMEGLYDRRVPGYLMKPFTDSGNAVEISKDTKKSQKEHYLLQKRTYYERIFAMFVYLLLDKSVSILSYF